MAEGYQTGSELTGSQEEAYLRSQHHFVLLRDEGRVIVELHWRIVSRHFAFSLDPQCLWKRIEPLSLEGTTVPNLATEDLLLILCAHGAKHGWSRLIWICDVAELIRAHPALNWGQVMGHARRLGGERMLLLGLRLAGDLLGARLPIEVLDRVQSDPGTLTAAARVQERLFGVDDAPSVVVEGFLLRLRLIERLPDRVRYALHFLHRRMTPNEHDRALLELPASLYPLYYLIRPVRLAGKQGRVLFRRYR
jgi:hypothetical protein